MELKKIITTTIREYLNENVEEYSKWKRKNVTLRGVNYPTTKYGEASEI
jgi:hypothetical protein